MQRLELSLCGAENLDTSESRLKSLYLSFRSCDSSRRLPEPKHHSFLFSH